MPNDLIYLRDKSLLSASLEEQDERIRPTRERASLPTPPCEHEKTIRKFS